MQKQRHILYIENDEDELHSLAELIEFEGFRVSKAAIAETAREILQENQIHLMLIRIDWPPYGEPDILKLVNDSIYLGIPKVIILIERDEIIDHLLKDNSSIVDFSYMLDPQRLKKLMAVLNRHTPPIL